MLESGQLQRMLNLIIISSTTNMYLYSWYVLLGYSGVGDCSLHFELHYGSLGGVILNSGCIIC